jgi:two-component system OmpR family response regulator/two-component system response regulator QseB
VAESTGGRSAVEHLKQEQVDLLLLDLGMPQGDGFEVLDYLQAHRRALPVILLSGMTADDIQRGMHRMRERHLPPLLLKPIDPDQLISMVELHLSGELPATGWPDRPR